MSNFCLIEFQVMSNKRMSDLDTLQDFIQSATSELIWMNEKEEIEVSRDWSSKSLHIPDIEDYQKVILFSFLLFSNMSSFVSHKLKYHSLTL